MKMDRYLYVNSDESDNYFSLNEAHKFKVHLKVPLQFSGIWTVGLVEFHADINKSRMSNVTKAFLYFQTYAKVA